MWLRLRLADLRIIAHYVGLFVVGIGSVMVVPLATALVFREWDPALDYVSAWVPASSSAAPWPCLSDT